MTDPALVAAHAAALHTPAHALSVSWDGGTWTDESGYVVSLSGVESVDPALGQVNTSEVNVVLDNSTRRYDPDNAASPLHPYLSHAGQSARLDLGYNCITTRVGTYTLDDLAIRDADGTAEMRLLDRAAWLDSRTVNVGPEGSINTADVVREICGQLGLVEGADFVVETGDTNCQFAACVQGSALHELQAVAFAEGGRLWVDPDGVVRFASRTTHRDLLASPLATLTRSQAAYDAPRVRRRDGSVNRVVLEYDDRSQALADETVYDQKTPLAVGAATSYQYYTWSVQNILGVNQYVRSDTPVTAYAAGQVGLVLHGMDMTRWERSLPLVFTTISAAVANTKANGSGSAVPVTIGNPPAMSGFSSAVYLSWTPNGSTGSLLVTNLSAAPAYVTTLRISGRPARTVSPFSVTADDVEAQQDGVVEARIRNAYLPSTDAAAGRAADYLWFRSGTRARIDPTIDGCPYLHPLDAFAFLDDSASPSVTYYLQVLRNEWSYSPSAGYTSSLRTAPALPPSDQVLDPTAAVAPADGGIVTATDSGPWTWGGAHPLVWTWSEWG